MDTILDFCRALPIRTYQKGETILPPDEVSDRLLILIEGPVAVVKNGTEIARITEPGAIFGEISVLLGVPTSARVAAKGTVRVHEVENASEYLRQSNALLEHTGRILAKRLLDATSYLVDIKQQYEGRSDHFGMVDQVLETLLMQQDRWSDSERLAAKREAKSDDSRF